MSETFTPQQHYNSANQLFGFIKARKDDPEFTNQEAQLIVLSAIAQSLQGILRTHLIDDGPVPAPVRV
jgi:hypothetical protein